jgi:hypothetical protein
MVQFNLLPAVKLEFVKARRIKRMLTLVSIVVSAAALTVLLLAFISVNVVQKKSLRDLNKDVSKYSNDLKNTKDLDKILTVQNQLGTLTTLHDQKAVASRLFGYITQVTPSQASLNSLNVDFVQHTITLGGAAPSLDIVSTYTDTLKATTYKVGSDGSPTKAFSGVVLTSFGRDAKNATFTISTSFDPNIFDSSKAVALSVPTGATTSQASLFGTGN